jgi:hypothetical protein
VVGIAPRGRPQVRNIGTAARLRDGERGDHLAREYLRQHARLHRFRAAVQDRRRADRVAEEARRYTATACSTDLLHRDDAHEAVTFCSAISLRKAETHIANRGRLFIEFTRELAGLVPIVGEGLDLARDELAQRLPKRLVL